MLDSAFALAPAGARDDSRHRRGSSSSTGQAPELRGPPASPAEDADAADERLDADEIEQGEGGTTSTTTPQTTQKPQMSTTTPK
eukprot:3541436-Heterocapsa_arctica.AAC.1